MADVIVINKVDTADREGVFAVRRSLEALNPRATVIEAASPITVDDPAAIYGKRVLVIEDGPTLTHGEMAYGAGWMAARQVRRGRDRRPASVCGRHDRGHLSQISDHRRGAAGHGLRPRAGAGAGATIRATPADVILVGTPIDLRRVLKLDRPAQRVRYDLQEIGHPTLADVLAKRFGK